MLKDSIKTILKLIAVVILHYLNEFFNKEKDGKYQYK